MNERDLKIAIENSDCFKNYPKFKQSLVLKRQNIIHLHDLYGQASRLGIDYLKQNQNLLKSEILLIEEIINNRKTN